MSVHRVHILTCSFVCLCTLCTGGTDWLVGHVVAIKTTFMIIYHNKYIRIDYSECCEVRPLGSITFIDADIVLLLR